MERHLHSCLENAAGSGKAPALWTRDQRHMAKLQVEPGSGDTAFSLALLHTLQLLLNSLPRMFAFAKFR